jgi:hypothetical protein
MILAETSYKSRRFFPDVKEGVAGRDYLKTWGMGVLPGAGQFGHPVHVQDEGRLYAGVSGQGEVSQSAHMKSFS